MKNFVKKLFVVLVALVAVLTISACDKKEDHVHEPEKIEAKAASCTEEGKLEHWKCKGCDKLFEDEACTKKTTDEKLTVEPTGHKSSDDGDCTTAVKCSVCEVVITEAKAAHSPESDDGDCTTAVKCSACEVITTEAKAAHTPEADDGDCTTAVKCSVCELITTEASEKHVDLGFDGNCDRCEYEFDYIHDETSNTYIVFTAEGLYAWEKDSWKGINLLLKRDIVMPTELKFDLDEDGVPDSNWPGVRFSSTFDGNGHSISGVIMKSAVERDIRGFATTINSSAVLKNLRLLDADMSFVGINFGILVGYNDGLIENCSVSGKIYADGNNVAGIAGTNSGTIIACYNDAEVFATAGTSGGIVGQNIEGNDVIGCYNTGAILSESSSVGGIVGSLYGGKLIATYSTSEVTGSYNLGAVIGYKDSSAEPTSNYWSISATTPEYGIGNKANNENAENVDGESVTWANVMAEMNAALEAYGTEYRYSLNTGADSDIRPLVLSIP